MGGMSHLLLQCVTAIGIAGYCGLALSAGLFVLGIQIDLEIPGLGKLFWGSYLLFCVSMLIFVAYSPKELFPTPLGARERVTLVFLMAAFAGLGLLALLKSPEAVILRIREILSG